MDNYFLKLELIHPGCVAKILHGEKLPKNGLIWEFTNDIKPIDLYCYLFAKYGQPNGLQNFLRADDSGNLIHWEWTFASNDGLVSIQGHNFRTEVHLTGNFRDKGLTLEMFLAQIKSDIGNYGKKMSELRKTFEKWTQFVNPFHRIQSVVNQHFKKLNDLNLDVKQDKVPQPKTESDFKTCGDQWSSVADKYSFALGIVFGLRTMLPVLAESFVNLLLFVLGKPEIKGNERLFQNAVRQPIDIRVQSLHLNCIGFNKPIDYASDTCKKFHTLMNERNDLLHGNVEPNKLAFGNVYFTSRVPLFVQYEDFWDKSIGVSIQSVKLDSINGDYETVKLFIGDVLGYLDQIIRDKVEVIMEKSQLGYNEKTGRIGILFPDQLVDFRAFAK